MLSAVADLRLRCWSCGVKWFVTSGTAAPDELPRCAACGGELAPLDLPAEAPRPGWDEDPEL